MGECHELGGHHCLVIKHLVNVLELCVGGFYTSGNTNAYGYSSCERHFDATAHYGNVQVSGHAVVVNGMQGSGDGNLYDAAVFGFGFVFCHLLRFVISKLSDRIRRPKFNDYLKARHEAGNTPRIQPGQSNL